MATERRTSRVAGNPGGGSSDWLTLGQAATYLGVAQSTVRKWSDGGRLSAFYTPGGHRRFRRADLDAFLAGSSGGTATAEKPLVLVVDDDEQLREFIRVNLEMDGYVVREAGSAAEATVPTRRIERGQATAVRPFADRALGDAEIGRGLAKREPFAALAPRIPPTPAGSAFSGHVRLGQSTKPSARVRDSKP